MYVATVPNRNSPPAILLRESYRQDGKVKTRTLANISHLPAHQLAALRSALAGSLPASSTPLPDSFHISRSLPHGHVVAVLGCLRNLQLDAILDPAPSRQRDLVIAMIVARIIDPASKLATARGLHSDTLHHSLGEMLHLDSADETELYQAMDWLLPQQSRIEQALAQRHLSQGGLVLYDLTSTYFEGRHCPLAKLGHSRDDKSGKLQIVFGLLTNASGCPVAVEVFAGNTSDPKTVAAQVNKLRQRFGLSDMVLIGDRGMITSARIREDLPASQGIQWISALRATQIQKLAAGGQLQMSLFDQTDLVEIAHPDFPGERLIACFNPLLAEERARKRPELLAATEKQLEKIAAATQRPKRPLRGKQNIGLRAGKILNRYKMGKHFQLRIEENSFHYERKTANIEREQNPGWNLCHPDQRQKGSVIQSAGRSELQELIRRGAGLPESEDRRSAGAAYQSPLAESRPRPHPTLRVGLLRGMAHAPTLAPLLFDDEDKPQAQAARASIVAPAQRSATAKLKALTKQTGDGMKVHSFQTLIGDLATIVKNRIQPADQKIAAFDMLTQPTVIQQHALDLLAVTLRPN